MSPSSALPSGRIPYSSLGFNQTWLLASLKQADHIFSSFRLAWIIRIVATSCSIYIYTITLYPVSSVICSIILLFEITLSSKSNVTFLVLRSVDDCLIPGNLLSDILISISQDMQWISGIDRVIWVMIDKKKLKIPMG